MNRPTPVLCSAQALPASGDDAPEWLHLLPAGLARTADGRGPFQYADAAGLITASMAGGKLALDECHATDLAAPSGAPAPARGWIVAMQARADGIWGQVEWVDPAAQVWRGYRGVSPVILHDASGTVSAILRASLTNVPNLTGLVALHQAEKHMDFRTVLLELLGLGSDADEAAVTAAIAAWKDKAKVEPTVALQQALAPIAQAVGVAATADPAAVLAGVQALKTGGDDRVIALQQQLGTVTVQLTALEDAGKRDKATAFVDAAIAAGRVGLKPVRDDYIAMHQAEPARAEKLIGAMPIVAPGATTLTILPPAGAAPTNPTLLAQKATAYQAKLAADGTQISYPAAVRAVHEGKAA